MTEKNYNPEQRNTKNNKRTENLNKNLQNNKQKIVEESKLEVKKENNEDIKKETAKLLVKKIPKTEAVVNGIGLPISSKQSFAIGRFIKFKEINAAIKELEEILLHKKPLPMKGEIAHRKGKIMSGRYPRNSIREFIRLLKNLNANANVNEINNPVIYEVCANFA